MTPQFKSFADFAAMGGHSGYVFGAWGLSIGVIILLIVRAIATGRRQKERLKALDTDSTL
jgi:heme exporter protein CcmD